MILYKKQKENEGRLQVKVICYLICRIGMLYIPYYIIQRYFLSHIFFIRSVKGVNFLVSFLYPPLVNISSLARLEGFDIVLYILLWIIYITIVKTIIETTMICPETVGTALIILSILFAIVLEHLAPLVVIILPMFIVFKLNQRFDIVNNYFKFTEKIKKLFTLESIFNGFKTPKDNE